MVQDPAPVSVHPVRDAAGHAVNTGQRSFRWRHTLATSRVLWHTVALAAVSASVFLIQRDSLFWNLDGLHALQVAEEQFRWMPLSWSLGLDPYRGPGNLFLPSNSQLIPTLLVQQLAGHGAGRLATYVLYNCQIFLLLCLLAGRLRVSLEVGILAGWCFALLATPLIWTDNTTLIFPMFALVPRSFDLVTFDLIFLIAFLEIGRTDVAGCLALTACCVLAALWFAAASPIGLVMTVPHLATVGLASVAATTRYEAGWKLTAIGAVSVIFWASGAWAFVYGFLKSGPTSFFGSEIETYQSGRWWSAIAYQYDRFPWGSAASIASLCAASYIAIRRIGLHTNLFTAAIGHAIFMIGMLVSWATIEHVTFLYDRFRHVRVFYFELPALAFEAIFAAIAIAAALALLPPIRFTRSWFRACDALVAAVVVFLVIPHVRNLRRNNPYPLPAKATRITEYLHTQIGLVPGSRFQGRVATVFTPHDRERASWDAMISHDVDEYSRRGNDLRFVGLWAFGIPTLQEYSQIITPGTYFWITRAMSTGNDVQDMRNTALITRIDVPLLRLFGVRFVIGPTRSDPDPSIRQVLTDGDDGLYEVPDTNIGSYFATSIVKVRDISEMFQAIHTTDDLLKKTVVFEDVPSQLSPATVTISMERMGLALRGRSQGTSLAVLPFTYTHCYAASTAAASNGVRLVRANMNMLGVLFQADLDVTLQMSTGLFHRTDCLRQDADDLERFGLAKAARAIPRGALVAGRSRNPKPGENVAALSVGGTE